MYRFDIVDAVHPDTSEKYSYKVGVCTTPDIPGESSVPSDCAVVQTDTKDSNVKNVCAGKVTQTQVARSEDASHYSILSLLSRVHLYLSCVTHFTHSAKDGVWIELTYYGGKNYSSHCANGPRISRLIFLCDPLIQGLVS